MRKYCEYCGNRLKIANSVWDSKVGTDTYLLKGSNNYKILIIPELDTCVIYTGEGDYQGGKIAKGRLNLGLTDILNHVSYRRALKSTNNFTSTYFEVLPSEHSFQDALKLSENIDVNNSTIIIKRYIAYLTSSNNSLLRGLQSYGSEQEFISFITSQTNTSENGGRKKAPAKMVSAEEGWKELLEGEAMKHLLSDKILFLMGDSPGMSAAIKNVLKNQYDGLDKLARFKKDSPPQGDSRHGEKDYYDIVLYSPSIKSRLRKDVEVFGKTVVSFEEKYNIADITIDKQTYKIGLIHRVD